MKSIIRTGMLIGLVAVLAMALLPTPTMAAIGCPMGEAGVLESRIAVAAFREPSATVIYGPVSVPAEASVRISIKTVSVPRYDSWGYWQFGPSTRLMSDAFITAHVGFEIFADASRIYDNGMSNPSVGDTLTDTYTFHQDSENVTINLTGTGEYRYDISWSCSDPAVTDNRVNGSDRSVAVYADETGISLYGLDAEGNGLLKAAVGAAELANLPDKPAENMLLAQSEDGKFTIYKLTSGEYQVNVGPDASGLVKVWIWKGLPPEPGSMYRKDFNINTSGLGAA